MPGIIGKEVLWNDGEGITFTDLNNMQRYMSAMILDGIISRMARSFGGADVQGTQTTFPLVYCFCVGNDAAPYAGAGAREIKNLAGTIYQRLDNTPDGNDPGMLAYYVTADEYGQTLAAAVTNPRWDIVTVKLEQIDNDVADEVSRDFKDATTGVVTSEDIVKKRKVKATFTVTAGAENASPVQPSIPAGHVLVAAFLVTPAMSAFDPRADIRDWRVPLGYRCDQVNAKSMLKNESFWTDAIFWMESTTDDAFAYALCPAGGLCRVMGFTVAGGKMVGATASTATLVRLPSTDQTIAPVTIVEMRSAVFPSTGFKNAEVSLAPVSESGSLAYPLWSNGFTAGYAVEHAQNDLGSPSPPDDDQAWNTLALAFSTQDTDEIRIGWVRWHLMGAL